MDALNNVLKAIAKGIKEEADSCNDYQMSLCPYRYDKRKQLQERAGLLYSLEKAVNNAINSLNNETVLEDEPEQKGVWKKRSDTNFALWEYEVDGKVILCLGYEGCTDMDDGSRRCGWGLYDDREHGGRHRWTFGYSEPLEKMKAFAERLLYDDDFFKEKALGREGKMI